MSKEYIGNYVIDGFSNNNAGSSKWTFGEKDGKKYFIKEFLTPVYPQDDSGLSEKMLEKKRNICKDFENDEEIVITKINNSSDGNILRINEFFRYGSKYYIAMDKISAIDIEVIKEITYKEKLMLVRSLAHSLSNLHAEGLLHGDIKIDNIMFYVNDNKFYNTKIIDVDGCKLIDKISEINIEDMAFDMMYIAPELYNVLMTGEGKYNQKIDVFAMGIVFHQIFSGKFPHFDKEKYTYLYASIMDGIKPELDKTIDETTRELICEMLSKNPDERPSMAEVFERLPLFEEDNKNDISSTSESFQNQEKITSSGGLKITFAGNKYSRDDDSAAKIDKTIIKNKASEDNTYFHSAGDL